MLVRLRLFAILRERAGSAELELELPERARVRDALAAVSELAQGLPLVLAVNRTYAEPDQELHAGDELALIPPVSGGAGPPPRARVTAEALSADALRRLVADPRAGAIVLFEGVTRGVPELEYEVYAEMAEPAIEAIVAAAIERHALCAAAAWHRVGVVRLGEAAVIVAVSAPHRPEAFAGAREIIDELKATVPIWKREDGRWVDGAAP
ncbi:MAG: molybdenum cofactor biosynthesis protein MoaE [Solirubrobacteraceae bacterium]